MGSPGGIQRGGPIWGRGEVVILALDSFAHSAEQWALALRSEGGASAFGLRPGPPAGTERSCLTPMSFRFMMDERALSVLITLHIGQRYVSVHGRP